MAYDAKTVKRHAHELTALAEVIPQAFEHEASGASRELKIGALPVGWQNHT